jgi:hypothetical protein
MSGAKPRQGNHSLLMSRNLKELSDDQMNPEEEQQQSFEKVKFTMFPTFDNRQLSKLNSSIYSNQKRYNPKEKPQSHVMIRQTS